MAGLTGTGQEPAQQGSDPAAASRQVPQLVTVEPMVLRSPLGWESLPPRRHHPFLAASVAIFVAVTATIASFLITLPYYAIAPGSARTVTDLITVADGAEKYPPEGEVLLTTVSLGETKAIEAFAGWLDDDVDVVRREQIVPPETSGEEFRELNQLLMEDSQMTAVVVALRRLGHEISEHGEGGLVASVVPGYPADGVLEPGSVIRSVAGTPTPLSRDVVAAIQSHAPGDTVQLEVSSLHGDATSTVEVRLAAHPETRGAFLGVEVRTAERRFDLPFDVDIDAGAIGGPSAGLAFTLAVIDVLTPGELTGGRSIAVTGTIDLDNNVGAVGGVGQKAAAVRDAGIEVFLVPAGEADKARARVGDDVQIVPVNTLDEALSALGDLGGDLSALGPSKEAAS